MKNRKTISFYINTICAVILLFALLPVSVMAEEIITEPPAISLEEDIPCPFSYKVIENEVEITGYGGYDSVVEIPDQIDGLPVTGIGDQAFRDCSGITEITIPDSVEYLGKYAFQDCSLLKAITIPASVNEIGGGAFLGCSSLAEADIAGGITCLEPFTFYQCINLEKITLPASLVTIKDYAFSQCFGLTELTLPDSVTSIGESVFSQCSSLAKITLPDSVTSIGTSSFDNCDGLTIYGNKESYGRVYAKDYNIPFVSLNGDLLVKTITLNEQSVRMYRGETFSLTAAPEPFDAENTELIWESSNPDIAAITVNENAASCMVSVKAKDYGTAEVTATAKDGSGVQASCQIIVAKPISLAKVSMEKTSYTYTGRSIKPAVVVKDGSTILKEDIDYSVICNSKNVGAASLFITGIGKYNGTVERSIKIIPKGTAIKSITPQFKAFTVKWNMQASQTEGYQIQYCTRKDFSSGVKWLPIEDNQTTSIKIRGNNGLKSGQTYYVRIRTLLHANGKNWYSKWSAAKSVTLKKLKSTISLQPKTVTWNGSRQSIGPAKISGSETMLTYTYYVDAKCKTKTTPANSGAKKTGSAPKYAGKYYVKASVQESADYLGAESKKVSFVIKPKVSCKFKEYAAYPGYVFLYPEISNFSGIKKFEISLFDSNGRKLNSGVISPAKKMAFGIRPGDGANASDKFKTGKSYYVTIRFTMKNGGVIVYKSKKMRK